MLFYCIYFTAHKCQLAATLVHTLLLLLFVVFRTFLRFTCFALLIFFIALHTIILWRWSCMRPITPRCTALRTCVCDCSSASRIDGLPTYQAAYLCLPCLVHLPLFCFFFYSYALHSLFFCALVPVGSSTFNSPLHLRASTASHCRPQRSVAGSMAVQSFIVFCFWLRFFSQSLPFHCLCELPAFCCSFLLFVVVHCWSCTCSTGWCVAIFGIPYGISCSLGVCCSASFCPCGCYCCCRCCCGVMLCVVSLVDYLILLLTFWAIARWAFTSFVLSLLAFFALLLQLVARFYPFILCHNSFVFLDFGVAFVLFLFNRVSHLYCRWPDQPSIGFKWIISLFFSFHPFDLILKDLFFMEEHVKCCLIVTTVSNF